MNTPENKMLLTKADFSFYNDASYRAIYMQLLNGNGRMQLNSQNGIRNIGLSYYDGNGRGYIYVADTNGAPQAGLYINHSNEGVIYADVKNFRVKHPEKSQKEIWYASLEGPEVGAYDRGS